MSRHTLKIELVNPESLTLESFHLGRLFLLEFEVLDTPIAELWLERMNQRHQWPMDDPNRFYGFNSAEKEFDRAEQQISDCIEVINSYQKIIHRPFTHARDQDCLNYLHNIFEQYHGLLDQQDHEFWKQAPTEVRQALANLNVAVHRCESLKNSKPRMVCTWFGMPKTQTLSATQINRYGQLSPRYGSVCLNYAEIGKTLENLAHDNDEYIGDDAFRPFDHYSADFVVRFYSDSAQDVQKRLQGMQHYYNQNIKFFHDRGYDKFDDPRLQPLRFPVAQLVETMPRDQLYSTIAQHQHINRIWIE